MPHGSFSCALDVVAQASDPDGDPLTYSWSGCAAGDASKAVCTIRDPGAVTATVAVDDGHGHRVTASGSAQVEREAENAAPSVTVVFPSGDECTPSPGRPCVLDVFAQASDPDGDPLQYSWSGCATGNAERAVCSVASPGQVTAAVTVDDGQGHAVSASGLGIGVNRLPDVSIGHVVAVGGEIDLLGTVVDPEDGTLCGAQYCGGVETTGACGTASIACSCLAGLEVRIARAGATGACTVAIEVKDKWGAVGKPSITTDVGTLQILGHTAPEPAASRKPRSHAR
jgi:hypothetical protein